MTATSEPEWDLRPMQVLPNHWQHALNVANRRARTTGKRCSVRWSGGYWLVEETATPEDGA